MPSDTYCFDCETSKNSHISRWIDYYLEKITPTRIPIPYLVENTFSKVFLSLCIFLKIAKLDDSYELSAVSPRLALFIQAARARSITCYVLKIANNYTEYLVIEYQDKRYYFEGFPTASHFNSAIAEIVSSKIKTKQHLKSASFPTPRGSVYSFWQKKHAVQESINILGFPLVVKPANGTFSRHVTTNILDKDSLNKAIDHAVAYQPAFVIEEYICTGSVHRVLVIDFKVVAVAKQVPAHIIGNGSNTIAELMDIKNLIHSRHPFLHDIPPIQATSSIDSNRIPNSDEVVYLQRDPFARLGADLVDETASLHPKNKNLCEQIARHFDIRCAGIDVIFEDCTQPWDMQRCAVLDINNLPSIEMHLPDDNTIHPTVPEALVDVFIKYYANNL